MASVSDPAGGRPACCSDLVNRARRMARRQFEDLDDGFPHVERPRHERSSPSDRSRPVSSPSPSSSWSSFRWSQTGDRSRRASSRRRRSREQGEQIHDLYTIVFYIAAAIFFVVEGLIVWSVIRYRRKPGDDIELPPQTHGHNLAEIVWTVVPTIIVIFLFFISWQTLNNVDDAPANPDLRVRAVAGQFQWRFDYLAADAAGDAKALFSQSMPTWDPTEGSSYPPARPRTSTSPART